MSHDTTHRAVLARRYCPVERLPHGCWRWPGHFERWPCHHQLGGKAFRLAALVAFGRIVFAHSPANRMFGCVVPAARAARDGMAGRLRRAPDPMRCFACVLAHLLAGGFDVYLRFMCRFLDVRMNRGT